MDIDVQKLSEFYREYNKKYFNSVLKEVPIKLSNSTRKFGEVKWFLINGKYRVEHLSISKVVEWKEKELRDILIHEMIHVWQIQFKNTRGHDSFFKNKMRE